MRINASGVALEGSAESRTTRAASVTQTITRSTPRAPAPPPPRGPEARAADRAEVERIPEGPERDLMLVRLMLREVFGIELDVSAAFEELAHRMSGDGGGTDAATSTPAATSASPARPPAATAAPVVTTTTRVHEETHEWARVSGAGTVQTADGRTIAFALDLRMERHAVRDFVSSVTTGGPPPGQQVKDPLVIDLAGGAPRLTSARFDTDVDGDGTTERVAWATGSSGFVAYDANGDGLVGAGELVGGRSGDAFADLAAFDADGNGWVDEGDAAWGRLLFTRRAEDGTTDARSLAAVGVGALSVLSVASPFTLTDGDRSQGLVRATGVALTEDGRALATRHVDLVV